MSGSNTTSCYCNSSSVLDRTPISCSYRNHIPCYTDVIFSLNKLKWLLPFLTHTIPLTSVLCNKWITHWTLLLCRDPGHDYFSCKCVPQSRAFATWCLCSVEGTGGAFPAYQAGDPAWRGVMEVNCVSRWLGSPIVVSVCCVLWQWEAGVHHWWAEDSLKISAKMSIIQFG